MWARRWAQGQWGRGQDPSTCRAPAGAEPRRDALTGARLGAPSRPKGGGIQHEGGGAGARAPLLSVPRLLPAARRVALEGSGAGAESSRWDRPAPAAPSALAARHRPKLNAFLKRVFPAHRGVKTSKTRPLCLLLRGCCQYLAVPLPGRVNHLFGREVDSGLQSSPGLTAWIFELLTRLWKRRHVLGKGK